MQVKGDKNGSVAHCFWAFGKNSHQFLPLLEQKFFYWFSKQDFITYFRHCWRCSNNNALARTSGAHVNHFWPPYTWSSFQPRHPPATLSFHHPTIHPRHPLLHSGFRHARISLSLAWVGGEVKVHFDKRGDAAWGGNDDVGAAREPLGLPERLELG